MAWLEKKHQYPRRGDRYFQTYVAVFEDPHRTPRRKRVILQTKSKAEARSLLVRLEEKHRSGDFDPWNDRVRGAHIVGGAVPLTDAIDLFVTDRRQYCSKPTSDTYDYILRSLAADQFPRSPGFPLHGVTQRNITAFLGRDIADATRRSYEQRLRIFFRWCIDNGLCKHDPVPQIKRSKISQRRDLPEYLTGDQFDHLVNTIRRDGRENPYGSDNLWLEGAMVFAAYTGLRRAELTNLQWRHIDFASEHLLIANTETFTTKSGRERRVPLKGPALEVIRGLADSRKSLTPTEYVFKGANGDQVNAEYLSKRFRHYRRLAGLPKEINFHSLRHTFASWAVQRRMNLYALKEILGHADIKQTQVYASLSPDALTREMDRAFGEARAA